MPTSPHAEGQVLMWFETRTRVPWGEPRLVDGDALVAAICSDQS